jgi:MFS family permease
MSQTTFPLVAGDLIHLGPTAVGIVAAAGSAIAVIVMVLLAARIPTTRAGVALVGSLVLMAISFPLIGEAHDTYVLVIGVLLLGVGGGLAFPTLITAVGGTAGENAQRGARDRPIALLGVALSISLAIGPFVETGVLDAFRGNLRDAFLWFTLAPAGAAAVLVLVLRKRKRARMRNTRDQSGPNQQESSGGVIEQEEADHASKGIEPCDPVDKDRDLTRHQARPDQVGNATEEDSTEGKAAGGSRDTQDRGRVPILIAASPLITGEVPTIEPDADLESFDTSKNVQRPKNSALSKHEEMHVKPGQVSENNSEHHGEEDRRDKLGQWQSFRRIMSDPGFQVALFGQLLYAAPFVAIVVFGALMDRHDFHLSAAGTQIAFGVFFAVSFVVRSLLAWQSPIPHKIGLFRLSSVLTLAGLIILALSHGVAALLIAMAVLGIPHGLTFPLAMGLVAEDRSHSELAEVNAHLSAAVQAVNLALPLVLGIGIDAVGYREMFLVLLAPVALASAAQWVVAKRMHNPHAAAQPS